MIKIMPNMRSTALSFMGQLGVGKRLTCFINSILWAFYKINNERKVRVKTLQHGGFMPL